MNRKELVAAVHAGTDGMRGRTVDGRRYVGRDFKTGEAIEIDARRSVIFRSAKELRQAL